MEPSRPFHIAGFVRQTDIMQHITKTRILRLVIQDVNTNQCIFKDMGWHDNTSIPWTSDIDYTYRQKAP